VSMLKKTLIYLGLGPDEEYDAFDAYAPDADASPVSASGGRVVTAPQPVVQSATVRPIEPARSPSVRVVEPVQRERPQAIPEPAVATTTDPSSGAKNAVRIVENRTATPHHLAPTTFNDAQGIGDRFKSGQPVIVNIQGAELNLRRRLIDFASGLCYALDGKMDRITETVYLLSPADVDIADADRRGFE